MLAACTTPQPAGVGVNWNAHRRAVMALEGWQLRGRLNIRTDDSSETINISWRQAGPDFVINFSGSFGLGAVQIQGSDTGVIVERSGEEPIQAGSLEAVSSDYLGYEFPASRLYYWIRGIPAPQGNADINLNPQQLLATLSQTDHTARRWELQYDRYAAVEGHYLPGRIRLEQSPYRLTFIISDWVLDPAAL